MAIDLELPDALEIPDWSYPGWSVGDDLVGVRAMEAIGALVTDPTGWR